VAEAAWGIGKERLQKAQEQQERLLRDREQKRRAEKPEADSPPAYHPNSIQVILGRLKFDSAGNSTLGGQRRSIMPSQITKAPVLNWLYNIGCQRP
jgi:hypothetical protein